MKISYSQINTYLSCGIRYEKKYIEKIPQLSTPTLVVGKAIHSGIEKNYQQKVTSRADLPISDLKDYVADKVEEGFQEELFLQDEEKAVGKEKLRGQSKDNAIKGIMVYHSKVSPTVVPTHVEFEFVVPIWDGHELWGFMDVLDEKNIIRDTKTTKKAPSGTAGKSQQLLLYTVAYKHLFGKFPKKAVLDYIVLTRDPYNLTLEAPATPATSDVEAFFRRVARVINGIQSGIFLPPSEPWQCLYCQYRDGCRERLL